MIKANIGGQQYSDIKESWSSFYVFEALRVTNWTGEEIQRQEWRRIPIKNKMDADQFAKRFKAANYVAARLIHDPTLQRRLDAAEKQRLEDDKLRARIAADALAKAEAERKAKARAKAKSKAKGGKK